MPIPDIAFPIFVYGIFKPGQLGFYQIEDLVEDCIPYAIPGELYERDGTPLLKLTENSLPINGYILTFSEPHREEAYQRISDMELDCQYKWDTHETNDRILVNVLTGKSPDRGGHYCEYNNWDGRMDPLFKEALGLVDAICSSKFEYSDESYEFSKSIYQIFHLQMAYMLLWSAIERYGSLKYGLKLDPMEKIKKISDEEAFQTGLQKYVTEERVVFRADKPSEKEQLNKDDPKRSIQYYYQVRCNSVHRGKSVSQEESLIKKSLRELQSIFSDILDASFQYPINNEHISV